MGLHMKLGEAGEAFFVQEIKDDVSDVFYCCPWNCTFESQLSHFHINCWRGEHFVVTFKFMFFKIKM